MEGRQLARLCYAAVNVGDGTLEAATHACARLKGLLAHLGLTAAYAAAIVGGSLLIEQRAAATPVTTLLLPENKLGQ
jgi:hypothetical protein